MIPQAHAMIKNINESVADMQKWRDFTLISRFVALPDKVEDPASLDPGDWA